MAKCDVAGMGKRGLLPAAAPKLPDWDPELLRRVDEVVLSARAGEHHDPDREHLQHLVVALKRCSFGMFCPVGLEGDLRHFAMIGPFCGDAFSPFGEPPCSSTMSGFLAWTRSSLSQIRRWSLKSRPPVTVICGPADTKTTGSGCSRPGVDHSEAGGREGASVP
jgi:hypothetical protein